MMCMAASALALHARRVAFAYKCGITNGPCSAGAVSGGPPLLLLLAGAPKKASATERSRASVSRRRYRREIRFQFVILEEQRAILIIIVS